MIGNVEYRDIPGFPGYRAGSDGSIWSCWRKGRPSVITSTWKLLKTSLGKHRYLVVTVGVGDLRKTNHVHRFVLLAFVGPRPEGMECRHLDGNRLNNSATNLAWGTPKENYADKKKHGTRIPNGTRGENCGTSKLTEAQVREIRLEYSRGNASMETIGRRFGVGKSAIFQVVRRKRWTHV